MQRQNVGVTLEVTPQINAGGTIKLDLRIEVSSIAGPVSSNFQDLILNKREIENTITVDEGEIVGIGGLLDDNDRRTLDRVPLLGDIPILGNLFRSRGRARARTNLMVFIRPTILRTAEDARAMTRAALQLCARPPDHRHPEPRADPRRGGPRLSRHDAAGRAGRAAGRRPGRRAAAGRAAPPRRPPPQEAPAFRRAAMKIARRRERSRGWPTAPEDATLLARMPYSFARRHGLLPTGEEDGQLDVAMREGADPKALIELRRFLARPFAVHEVDGPAFDRLLSDLYPSGTEAAADAAGSLGFNDDLGHLAAALPSAEDLLDTSDDAPAIRLINGIIADAARQGVSDIHIEPYETGPGRAHADGRRAARDAAHAAARRAGGGQPGQGDGAARHRRAAAAAGRADRADARRQADRRARLDPAEPGGRAGGAAHPRQGECGDRPRDARHDRGGGRLAARRARPSRTASCWSPGRPARARRRRSMRASSCSTTAAATSSPSRTRSNMRSTASARPRSTRRSA